MADSFVACIKQAISEDLNVGGIHMLGGNCFTFNGNMMVEAC